MNVRRSTVTKCAALLLVTVFVQGCVTSTHQKITQLARTDNAPKVLLMPVDVTLGHLTAGGLFEPQAEWTTAAEKHVGTALDRFLSGRNVILVPYKEPSNGDRANTHDQIVKLHRVVGSSTRIHQYVPAFQLPTKKTGFDWSLGPEVERLAEEFDADYALFVYMKDSYATAGRAAAMVFAAILGVGIQGGTQIGYASLVDLKNGEIVWFNALGRGEGDLRKEKPAAETVNLLMTKFPQ